MKEKVVIVTVTYGERWEFLSQVLNAVIHDLHLERFIVVNNGSQNVHELTEAKHAYGEKMEILETGSNIGSAGGYALGLARAREIPCDFVLMLDDDNVLEPNGLNIFISLYKSLSGRRVLSGYRPDIQDDSVFLQPPKEKHFRKTFFDVWSVNKLIARLGRNINTRPTTRHSIIKSNGFVYGGAFLPIKAVQEAPLPDKDLVLYGDDVEYSWGVLECGYSSYLSDRPIIRDVDMTFEKGDHVMGLFDPETKAFKVYYRLRNMVRISLRYTDQSMLAFVSSVVIWIIVLCVLGFFRFGLTRKTMGRFSLILKAVYAGFNNHAKVPSIAKLP